MDYTPNHHLPQWVKSDRIMMDDFNQMCRDMEAGLNRAEANADSSVGTLRSEIDNKLDSAQSDRARLYAVAGDMARDFYRQAVQQEFQHGSAVLSDSFWFNGLWRPREGPYTSGGTCGIRLSSPAATLEGVKKTMKSLGYVATVSSYTNKSRYAGFTFTSNGCGVITSVTLLSLKRTDVEFTTTLRLLREDTGRLVAESAPFTSQSGTMLSPYHVPVQFPLVDGVTYRMEFALPDSSTFNGEAHFAIVNGTIPDMTVAARPNTLNITKSITPPSWARSASGILHWAGSGTVSLSVNGTRLPVVRTTGSINAEGTACQEVEYTLASLPKGALTLTANMQRGSGALELYDYGLLWK